MEQAKVQLHKKDAISVNLWIDQLKEQNTLVFIKDKITPPPPCKAPEGFEGST
jgi:hypothetical protein